MSDQRATNGKYIMPITLIAVWLSSSSFVIELLLQRIYHELPSIVSKYIRRTLNQTVYWQVTAWGVGIF